MYLQSPRPLQEFCFNVLADNPNILWRWKGRRLFSEPNGVEWRDPELFLHSQLADRLLEILGNKRMLNDGMLRIFTQEHVCLKNVKIGFNDSITEDGLQVLSHHKLISLDIRCLLPMNIPAVLNCIGNTSYESLQHLILQRQLRHEVWPRDDDLCGQSVIETLSRFNCLKRVDVSHTDLSNTNLAILGKSLLHVENLNLSRNYNITDISPLKNCQKTLKSLSLGWLPDLTAESAMAMLVTLTGLTFLDVSLVNVMIFDSYKEYDSVSHRLGLKVFTADMLLQMLDVLPNLVCLDLSGRTVRTEQALSQFLDAHPSLQTLMLWGSAACWFQSLQDYRPRLTVGGDATFEQYAAVLRHWTTTDEHQGVPFNCSRRRFVLDKLIRDLNRKHFPPCGDDHLIQVMLGMFPPPSIPLRRETSWFVECFCLHAISLLLEKGILRHLEPDNKQHLLQFCHRVLQDHPKFGAQRFAVKIIDALG